MLNHIMQKMLPISVAALVFACPGVPRAQEVSALGGAINANGGHGVTESFGFSYLQPISDGAAALSFTWANEGPVEDNHRDGFAVQYWRRMQLAGPDIGLGIGVGPYVFFNTTSGGTRDQHGLGAMLSVTATRYLDSGFFYQLRINQTIAKNSFNSTAFLVGVGYDFGKPPSFSAGRLESPGDAPRNEVTAFAGGAVVNNDGTPADFAYAVEYRHLFDRHADATLTYLNEGDTPLSTRSGVAMQGWLRSDLLDRRLSLAVGLGPYFTIVQRTDDGSGQDVSLLLSMSVAWRISRQWNLRATWHRVATSYHRDSDVYLGGIGYRF